MGDVEGTLFFLFSFQFCLGGNLVMGMVFPYDFTCAHYLGLARDVGGKMGGILCLLEMAGGMSCRAPVRI